MKRSPRPASPRPTTIDDYLARLDDDERAALQALRATIRKAAPKAEECISYGLPAFRQNGVLVAFGASAKHLSLFPMNGSTVSDFQKDLAAFSTSTGTIRFTPAKPLPASLVRRIVKARIKENKEDRGTSR